MAGSDDTSIQPLDDATTGVHLLIAAAYDLAAAQARRMGTHVTDMRALSLLQIQGPLQATELARRLAISANAATALVDRLATSGHVDRVPHPTDRRRVVVRLRPGARDLARQSWLPSILDVDAISRSLEPAEHEAVTRFLERVTHSMNAHAQSD
ncbi:MarR family winged helix-turn-helix transcriptional regulator [Actinomycetospora straminea]|uniref:MarR family transcriptional regulator n=1 Tax=Actinomycetospora straminea TaxID=663607 RepID=A0ABP9ERH4_9PSEU|nr:MarR family transcriptional regulator [Actinomycetospora straminea]MDD7933807.1 MarR family transcriptional regulator [Actinomycetospora straminea]